MGDIATPTWSLEEEIIASPYKCFYCLAPPPLSPDDNPILIEWLTNLQIFLDFGTPSTIVAYISNTSTSMTTPDIHRGRFPNMSLGMQSSPTFRYTTIGIPHAPCIRIYHLILKTSQDMTSTTGTYYQLISYISNATNTEIKIQYLILSIHVAKFGEALFPKQHHQLGKNST